MTGTEFPIISSTPACNYFPPFPESPREQMFNCGSGSQTSSTNVLFAPSYPFVPFVRAFSSGKKEPSCLYLDEWQRLTTLRAHIVKECRLIADFVRLHSPSRLGEWLPRLPSAVLNGPTRPLFISSPSTPTFSPTRLAIWCRMSRRFYFQGRARSEP